MLSPAHLPTARPQIARSIVGTPKTGGVVDAGGTTTDLIFGERKLKQHFAEIFQLRARLGQQDDYTTDPQYFVAINAVKGKRVAAVLIRHRGALEACVLFFEYSKCGISLGVFRAGDQAGRGLVIGPGDLRVQHLALATRALLAHWRVSGLRLATSANMSECVATMGPETQHRVFFSQSLAHKLVLQSTYEAMLASMGARTRRSLATKRRQLESRAGAVFVPSLEPADALAAMLSLRSRSIPYRSARFCRARYSLACAHPEFFCMGVRSPDGKWLSVLSGWRCNEVTFVDVQMNDAHLKKSSLSAVMRAFMLEHEIGIQQKLVDFVDGTSLLLQRYCQPAEPCACAYLCRPGVRSKLFYAVIRRIEPEEFSRLFRPLSDGMRANAMQNAGISDSTEGHRSA